MGSKRAFFQTGCCNIFKIMFEVSETLLKFGIIRVGIIGLEVFYSMLDKQNRANQYVLGYFRHFLPKVLKPLVF